MSTRDPRPNVPRGTIRFRGLLQCSTWNTVEMPASGKCSTWNIALEGRRGDRLPCPSRGLPRLGSTLTPPGNDPGGIALGLSEPAWLLPASVMLNLARMFHVEQWALVAASVPRGTIPRPGSAGQGDDPSASPLSQSKVRFQRPMLQCSTWSIEQQLSPQPSQRYGRQLRPLGILRSRRSKAE